MKLRRRRKKKGFWGKGGKRSSWNCKNGVEFGEEGYV